MTAVTNELIYEVMKQMQSRLSNIESSIVDVKLELRAMRGYLNAVQVDVANIFGQLGHIEARVDRIEKRLDLVDEKV